jgi:pyruvate ferredoxin oxidoreductase alpha subunit/phenylglyoxylate dehydrogenase alpha subunit
MPDLVEVEGEHSALSVLRVLSRRRKGLHRNFRSGLAFMFEPYIRTAPLRLPIV